VLILFAATLFIGGVGAMTFYYLHLESLQATERTLAVIAEEKRERIEHWVTQTRSDAKLYFSGTSLLPIVFSQWLEDGRHNGELLNKMQAHLAEVAQARGWQGVALYDTAGQPVFKLGKVDTPGHAEQLQEVLRHPQIVPIDLHRNAHGTVEYGMLAPIGSPATEPLGVAYVGWRVDQTLFPLVRSWPIPTQSAETYLIRREDDQVRYLTPLRQQPDTALALNQPWTSFKPIADYASQSLGDVVPDTRDYRGVPILAYLTAIAGTPWLMIATIDQSETYSGIRSTAWATSLITGLALLLMYGAGYLIWRRELAGLRARQLSEKRFRRLLQFSPIPLSLIGKNGEIAFCNDRFVAVFGYTTADIPSREKWFELAYPDAAYRCSVLDSWATAVQHSMANHTHIGPIEYQVNCKNGERRLVEISGILLDDGLLTAFVDVTERRQMEHQLRLSEERQRHHLEELVKSRTLELVMARDAAESADRAKSDFLTHMTHELRTPLHAILGFTEVLAKLEGHDGGPVGDHSGNAGTEASRHRRKLLAILQRNGQHLLALVNDVLDLSRLEQGRLTLDVRPTALHTLLHDCVVDLTPLAADKGLSLRLEIAPGLAPCVRVDRRRLLQVLNNLLGNAVKYTARGEVRLQAATTPDPTVPAQVELRFTVLDTGSGIPAAEHERIFDAFAQAATGPGASAPQGSGLGLAISRHLIRQMGGEIHLDSEPGQGSRFTLNLPAIALSDPADCREHRASDDETGLTGTGTVTVPIPVTTVTDPPLTPPSISALMELRELAELGRTTRLEDWCHDWSAPGRQPAFAAHVLTLVHSFEHERIIALVNEHLGV
jgi:PAS domain S-box-containing protein